MNTAQKLSLTIGILSFLATGGTQLTDVFAPFGSLAPVIVKEIVSLAGLVSGVLGIVLTFTTGQAGQVQAIREMPGVEKLLVNKDASPTLAAMAVDPAMAKIEIKPGDERAVNATAKAGCSFNPSTIIQNPVSTTNLYQGEIAFDASLKTFNELKALCANRVLRPSCRTYVIRGQSLIAKAYAADKAARNFINNNPTLNAASVVAIFTSLVSSFQSTVTSLNATKA